MVTDHPGTQTFQNTKFNLIDTYLEVNISSSWKRKHPPEDDLESKRFKGDCNNNVNYVHNIN